MEPKRRIVLVPYDYSELSVYATKHAVQIAKITESDIIFLHVVNDVADEGKEMKRMQEVADGITNKYGVHTEVKIRVGRVSHVIKHMAQILDVFLVVMKTQPPKGKEKILGSRTIRAMIGSNIPFYVVQAPPQRLAMRKVVFPIDFRLENKEKLSWINSLSKFYRQKIFLVKPKLKDYRIRNNVDFARRFLEGKKINYEIVTMHGQFSNVQETLNYAHDIKADAVVIMLSKSLTFDKLLFGFRDQQYIYNKHKMHKVQVVVHVD